VVLPKAATRGVEVGGVYLSIQTAIRFLLLLAVSASLGCGLFEKSKASEESTTAEKQKKQEVVVNVPWDSSGRDDHSVPVLRVTVFENGADGVPVPFIYGYPLYAGGSAARGVLKLRQDNWADAEQEEYQDEHGVVHFREDFRSLKCAIEGIKETETKHVPRSLICDLPAPKQLGGKKRPVVGELRTGARADDVVMEPSLVEAFLGEWHLTDEGFAGGNGEAYFNTENGLLSFGFKRGRLVSIGYYFDPKDKRWQEPVLWIKP
jgi:hypothetical protein